MKVVDLFAGIGGFSLGFIRAGHKIVAAFDAWDKARDVYLANIKGHPYHLLDLGNVDEAVAAITPYVPDVIIGGPPCQDFSVAGKRNTEGARASLTTAYAQIIASIKPRFFVMENVKAIKGTQKLKEALAVFRAAGYGISQVVLDASYYEVPQRRERYFMVGQLGGYDCVFEAHIESLKQPKPMTVREAFGSNIGFEHYWTSPRYWHNTGIISIDRPSVTVTGSYCKLPPGYKGNPSDSAPPDPNVVHSLSVSDRLQIQSFPKDYAMAGGIGDQHQMVGNAVPPNLGKAIGIALTQLSKHG